MPSSDDEDVGVEAIRLAGKVSRGEVDADYAAHDLSWLEVLADTPREKRAVELLKRTISKHSRLARVLAQLGSSRSIHLVDKRGAATMIHPAVRPDAPPGSWQITTFALDGAPWGHRYHPGPLAEAVREVWESGMTVKEQRNPGDEDLRRLERAAQSGDPQAQLALWHAQLRAGSLPPLRVYHAEDYVSPRYSEQIRGRPLDPEEVRVRWIARNLTSRRPGEGARPVHQRHAAVGNAMVAIYESLPQEVREELESGDVTFVPVPSSRPGPPDPGIAELAARLSYRTNQRMLAALVRTRTVESSRDRRRAGQGGLEAHEHAATMRQIMPVHGDVWLVDNVVVSGATLEAARLVLGPRVKGALVYARAQRWSKNPHPSKVMRALKGKVGPGDCYPAAELVYHAGGGKHAGLVPMQAKHEGVSHWWVQGPQGQAYDPTAHQFRRPVPYSRGRGRGFLTKRPSKRARELGRFVGMRVNPEEQLDLFGRFKRGPLYYAEVHEHYLEPRGIQVAVDELKAMDDGRDVDELIRELYYYIMAEATPEELREFVHDEVGVDARRVIPVESIDSLGIWLYLDHGITIVPNDPQYALELPPGWMSRDAIREKVREFHRHRPDPPAGMLWGYSIYNGYTIPEHLIGVAMVGVPAPTTYQKGEAGTGPRVATVTRVAMNHDDLPPVITYQAASMVLDHAAKVAFNRGYDFLETFTTESESGRSMRYARWAPPGISRTKSKWMVTGFRRRADRRRGPSAARPEGILRWWKRLSDRWPMPPKPALPPEVQL